jgi:putative membrane protein
MSMPINVLASLLKLQDVEDHKPRVSYQIPHHEATHLIPNQLSKISWLPDVLVWRGSIIPTVAGPVLSVTLFSACVAAASLMYGKEVGLTNNVGQFTP